MKNDTNDGIYCDYCGEQLTGDFTYYSFDFRRVHIANRIRNKGREIEFSADVCGACTELFKKRLLDVGGIVGPSATRCDVSGLDMGPQDQTYYECTISKVDIDMQGQPYKCTKCGKPRDPQAGPCEQCDDTCRLIREAAVAVDKDHLELNFSNDMHDKFRARVEYIHGIGDSEWTRD